MQKDLLNLKILLLQTELPHAKRTLLKILLLQTELPHTKRSVKLKDLVVTN